MYEHKLRAINNIGVSNVLDDFKYDLCSHVDRYTNCCVVVRFAAS